MSDLPSFSLTPRQHRAMTHLGNALVPGGDGMPSYAEVDAARHAGRALGAARAADRDALLLLVQILGVVPAPLLRGGLILTNLLGRLPGMPGAPARLLDIGLRGLVLNTYYAGLDRDGTDGRSAVHQAMDFALQCEPPKGNTRP
ncbi:hypothetical protein [Isoalcanivorax indicus]|uniref:hypothetical protein n=1 Tax=Isoalcanivorax indicus TaxID=2202653 RepID=UPI000DBACE5C|nr:hypothetical protein [Isoalcanivorax indicus]